MLKKESEILDKILKAFRHSNTPLYPSENTYLLTKEKLQQDKLDAAALFFEEVRIILENYGLTKS